MVCFSCEKDHAFEKRTHLIIKLVVFKQVASHIESSSAQLSVVAESLSEQYNSPLKEPNTSLGMSLPAQVFCCLLSPRVMSGNTPDNQM